MRPMNKSQQPETQHADDDARALTHLTAHGRFWITAIIFVWLDLWSKHWAFSTIKPHEPRSVIDGWLIFRRSLNDGAVFGSFSGQTELFIVASILALAFVVYLFVQSPKRSFLLHIALGLILAGAVGNMYDRTFVKADIVSMKNNPGEPRQVVIGKIVSDEDSPNILIGVWPEGTFTQSFARADVIQRRQGVVRDFIKFVPNLPLWLPMIGGREAWPWVFNIADASLVCGVIFLLLTSSLNRRVPT